MQTKEWSFIDKSAWPRGEWDAEPDKMQFTTASGLPGLIKRNNGGVLCGYVGIAEGHPLFEAPYQESDFDVHGGLTFADFCAEDHEHGICHQPDPGEPERVWWFGFDCAHSGDYCPNYPIFSFGFTARDGRGDTYRNVAYVRQQVEHLAAQLIHEP